MRFAFYSCEATSLPFQARLQEEGEEVLVYVGADNQREVGDGIVPKTKNLAHFVDWGRAAPSVFIFDGNGKGELADRLRAAGCLVIGGGAFCDRLEKDRPYGQSIAAGLGIKEPETKEFSTISNAQTFIKSHKGADSWYFKSNKYLEGAATFGGSPEALGHYLEHLKGRYGDNISNILQKKVEGVAVSTACWWNGMSWVPPFLATIEHKKFLEGDKGPHTGCSLNIVWAYTGISKIVADLKFAQLADVFRKEKAPAGIYDINAVLTDEGPYFLEWTPRFGYDSEPTAFCLLTQPLGEFFHAVASASGGQGAFSTDNIAVAARLSVPPYPTEMGGKKATEFKKNIGTPVFGVDTLGFPPFLGYGLSQDPQGLYVSDPFGLLGLSVAVGRGLRKMGREVVDFAAKLEIPNLQYRSDVFETLAADIVALDKLGYETPEGV